MADYYNTDAQITDRLPTLTDSQIDTVAKRNAKLRLPAKQWIDSVYPGVAPFPPLGDNNPTAWLVNQAAHAAGALTVIIDGGSNNPAAGDFMRLEGHNAIYKVVSFAGAVVTYTWVEDYNPGVEETDVGAMADFLDDTPLFFGTPEILQNAATWYCLYIAYQIMRNNPLDEAAIAALEMGGQVLQVGEDGIARARPEPYYETARDASLVVPRFSPISVKVVR